MRSFRRRFGSCAPGERRKYSRMCTGIRKNSLNQEPENNHERSAFQYYSTVTVPSTEDSDKFSSYTARDFRRKGRRSQRRRRLIFKSKKAREATIEINDLIDEKSNKNEVLQAKLNYFFKPYSKGGNLLSDPPMNFKNDSQRNDDNFHKRGYSEDANLNWNRLCKSILNRDEEKMKELLLSINPSMYSRKKNINLLYYLNNFLKNSENEKKDRLKEKKLTDSLTEEKETFNPVADGIEILKSLLLDKIQTKQDQFEDMKNFQSTHIPKIDVFSLSESKEFKSQKGKKSKSRISWKNAETLIPSRPNVYSKKVINSKKLYNSLIKDWNEVKNSKELANNTFDFNKHSDIRD